MLLIAPIRWFRGSGIGSSQPGRSPRLEEAPSQHGTRGGDVPDDRQHVGAGAGPSRPIFHRGVVEPRGDVTVPVPEPLQPEDYQHQRELHQAPPRHAHRI